MMKRKSGPEERYITIREAAEHLGLSVRAVRRLMSAGELRAYRLSLSPAGALRFKVSDLEAWAETRCTSRMKRPPARASPTRK